MSVFGLKYYGSIANWTIKSVAAVLLMVLLGGCAGGSLFNPRPMNGRDRLVFRVVDQTTSTTYYTRNVWYDGDNFRFHDVYGREISVLKSDQVVVDIIGESEYYETP